MGGATPERHVVDLRSDTKTRPTAAMRAAMAGAEVGDEQSGEDPTVNELERRAAALLGHEAAVFMPTATMANQIALILLGRPGEELLLEELSHIAISEQGGAAVHARLLVRPVRGRRGLLDAALVRALARPEEDNHVPRTGVVALECTHNSAGGAILPPDEVAETLAACRELGLAVHLDGARLLNAAVALGAPPASLAQGFDAVSLCLSKGLGCPLGAVLAGSSALIGRARRVKHLFGGAMRQTGIVAAAGLYALDHHVDRLADDHARARRLAEGLSANGVAVRPVETNFVQMDVARHGLTARAAVDRLALAGVLTTTTLVPGVIRAVTHLDVDDAGIDAALARIPAALA
jgi:threonine aldolase